MKEYKIKIMPKLDDELKLMYRDYCNDCLETGCDSNLLPSFEEYLSYILFWFTDKRK